MVLTSKPAKEPKPTIVREHEQCESRHCAANLPVIRCKFRGDLYRVSGHLSTGFARLCAHHKGVFEKQGFTLELVSPIELAGRTTVTA